MQVSAVGMAWYKAENFVRLVAMFEDGDKLHRTYAEWLKAAEANYKRLCSQGVRVVKVDIDPDQFPKWCKTEGLKLNADARNKFASLMAYKVLTGVQDGGGVH
jgi:hypothetical protein